MSPSVLFENYKSTQGALLTLNLIGRGLLILSAWKMLLLYTVGESVNLRNLVGAKEHEALTYLLL